MAIGAQQWRHSLINHQGALCLIKNLLRRKFLAERFLRIGGAECLDHEVGRLHGAVALPDYFERLHP